MNKKVGKFGSSHAFFSIFVFGSNVILTRAIIMDFSTKVEIPTPHFSINHRQRSLLLGSCFAENMGQRMLEAKFNVAVNPFGITYNPASAAKIVNLLLDGYRLKDTDVLFDEGLYFSLMHHSRFSEEKKDILRSKINAFAAASSAQLQELDNLLVTFGTAWVYSWKENGEIVNNCHKLPSDKFERFRLSANEIVNEWSVVISRLLKLRPNMNVLFTVSPIRHWKDGAHENQLSKAILLLAIDELKRLFPQHVSYFPSYEIVMDELRDYRFYASDMIHLSETATEYCWKRFSETYFDNKTVQIIRQWQTISKAISHRPFREDSDEHQLFLKRTLEKIRQFSDNYPFIDCKNELYLIQHKIN